MSQPQSLASVYSIFFDIADLLRFA